MKITIKKINGGTAWEGEADNFQDGMQKAVSSRAVLRDAVLRDADLTGAVLTGAVLTGADLRRADLRDAVLTHADLRGADLRDAVLTHADLRGADLRGADLRRADLRGAVLTGADLRGADLTRADLRGADLRGAKGINKYLCTPLMILLDQPGKIRAYKLVNREGKSPIAPSQGHPTISYSLGAEISVPDACTEDTQQCAAGISLATLDWCIKEWREGYRIIIAEFEAADIAAIPIATDGKFRVHRCKIVGEKDLKEIGLVKEEEP